MAEHQAYTLAVEGSSPSRPTKCALLLIYMMGGKIICMANRMTDDYIDDLPEAFSLEGSDDAEAAFWDEFSYLEEKKSLDSRSYTVTLEDELTGDKKVFKNVKLGKFSKQKKLGN